MPRYEYIYEIVKDADGVDCFIKRGDIVRCRECKYASLTYDGDCKYCSRWDEEYEESTSLYLAGDFYCGFAERRTDG